MTLIAQPGDTSVATSNDTRVADPDSETKTLGFDEGYRPPAQWLNALFKRLHLWKEFLFRGVVGTLKSHGKTECNSPMTSANAGGAIGSWSINVAAIDIAVLKDCVFYNLPDTVLDCSHVLAADKLTSTGGNVALKAGGYFHAYLSKKADGSPYYYIRRTGPDGMWDFTSPDGVAQPGRYLFRFIADNQGTFTGAFSAAVGAAVPFCKVGRTVTYLLDDSTFTKLTTGVFSSVGLDVIDLGAFVPVGSMRAKLYLTATDKYITLGSNITNVGRVQHIDEGQELTVTFNTLATSEVWAKTTGSVGVYVLEYDDVVDGV